MLPENVQTFIDAEIAANQADVRTVSVPLVLWREYRGARSPFASTTSPSASRPLSCAKTARRR